MAQRKKTTPDRQHFFLSSNEHSHSSTPIFDFSQFNPQLKTNIPLLKPININPPQQNTASQKMVQTQKK